MEQVARNLENYAALPTSLGSALIKSRGIGERFSLCRYVEEENSR